MRIRASLITPGPPLELALIAFLLILIHSSLKHSSFFDSITHIHDRTDRTNELMQL